MILLALVAAGLLADELPDPPGLVARVGSPEFRHPRYASLLGTSADGKRLYTAEPAPLNDGNAALYVWEAATGQLLAKHHLGGDSADAIGAIGFGPEGVRVFERLERGSRHRLRIVDPDTGKTIRAGKPWTEPLQDDGTRGLARAWYTFSPDAAWKLRPSGRGYTLSDTATGAETSIDLGKPTETFGGDYLFSPGGRHFLVRVEGNDRLHELPGGKHVGDIKNAADQQHAETFTPDGKQLLLWTRREEAWTLDAYDLASKTRRAVLAKRSLPGHIHFAPDGRRFALVPGSIGSSYPAGDWEVRDFATGKELGRVPAVGYTGRALFSPDGRTLYTQPGDMVVPWDVATGRPAAGAPAVLGPVDRFRFTPDGKLVGLAGGSVYTWDATTAKELARERLPRTIDLYGGVAFNPAADRLHFTGVGDRLVAWDWRTRAARESAIELQRLPNSAVDHWFTPDGSRHVEYRYGDGLLILRDPATGKETVSLQIPQEWRQQRGGSAVYGLALSPDGRRLAIGGEVPHHNPDQKPAPSPLAVLSVNGSERAVMGESSGRVSALAFSPDGRFLVATLREQPAAELGVWNTYTGRRVATIPVSPTDARVNAVRFSPDGRMVAVSLGQHEVQLVETASWRVRARLPMPNAGSQIYFGVDRYRDVIAWSPEGRRLAASAAGRGLLIWDVRQLGEAKPPTDATALDGAWQAVAGTDARAAFAAICSLAESPVRAIPLLRAKVAPVPATDAVKLGATLAALGSEEFAEREAATADLEKLGQLAEPALRQTLRATTSPEVVRRVNGLLEKLAGAKPSAEEVLAARAVEVAEWAATPDAVRLLEAWAGGAADAPLTADARAALTRLGKK